MQLTDTFAALGNDVRLAIVERLLREGELAAGDLVAEGEMSAPAMSHHFKVLRDAGIVVAARRRAAAALFGPPGGDARDRTMVADLPRVLGAEPRPARPHHRKGEAKMSELRIERDYPIAPAALVCLRHRGGEPAEVVGPGRHDGDRGEPQSRAASAHGRSCSAVRAVPSRCAAW